MYVYNMRIFQLQVLCSLLSRTCNDIPQETNQKVELERLTNVEVRLTRRSDQKKQKAAS